MSVHTQSLVRSIYSVWSRLIRSSFKASLSYVHRQTPSRTEKHIWYFFFSFDHRSWLTHTLMQTHSTLVLSIYPRLYGWWSKHLDSLFICTAQVAERTCCPAVSHSICFSQPVSLPNFLMIKVETLKTTKSSVHNVPLECSQTIVGGG